MHQYTELQNTDGLISDRTEREINKSTIIAGEFNTLLSGIE
jgi:hypothetical protein